MVFDSFINIVYNELNRAIDAQTAKEEKEALVKSTVKEALLGCYNNWKTRSKYAGYDETDDMLQIYSQVLIDVSTKYRANDMLNESLYDRLLDLATRMKEIADEPKGMNGDSEYDEITTMVFDDIYQMFQDFDRLFDSSQE